MKIKVNKSFEDSWNYHPTDIVYVHKITINGESN